MLATLLCLGLAASSVGCQSQAEIDTVDKAVVEEILREYLPMLGRAYAERSPKLIEPWVVPKEVARIRVRIDELESKGQVYEPVFREVVVESISAWNHSNAFVSTVEEWDVRSLSLGGEQVITEALGQRSRVKYQLKRDGDGWVVLYRELAETLE